MAYRSSAHISEEDTVTEATISRQVSNIVAGKLK
jgi:hypothetical protein